MFVRVYQASFPFFLRFPRTLSYIHPPLFLSFFSNLLSILTNIRLASESWLDRYTPSPFFPHGLIRCGKRRSSLFPPNNIEASPLRQEEEYGIYPFFSLVFGPSNRPPLLSVSGWMQATSFFFQGQQRINSFSPFLCFPFHLWILPPLLPPLARKASAIFLAATPSFDSNFLPLSLSSDKIERTCFADLSETELGRPFFPSFSSWTKIAIFPNLNSDSYLRSV